MLDRRSFLTVLSVSSALSLRGVAFAKGPHKHMNGHNALGAKLKQNGKHEVGKAGKETVVAEVSNSKVVSMSAGSLPVKRVKTQKKMAGLDFGTIKVASNADIQLAQVTEVYYYGYGFDTGTEEVYYWFPAEDVVVTESWVEYTPV